MSRLTDHDRDYGPLTIGRSDWNAIRIAYSSGDNEETYNSLTVHLGKWFIARLKLPRIIRPFKEKVMVPSWDAATVTRMGRDFYYNYFCREYGFCSVEQTTIVHYGVNNKTGGSDVASQSRFFNHPWSQTEVVVHELYDANDKLHWEAKPNSKETHYKKSYEAGNDISKISYLVEDYDGFQVIAETYRSLMIWETGVGWCKFVRLFTKPFIKNCLEIQFTQEVGPSKGSWKGGLIGTSIAIEKGETRDEAFLRYCQQQHSDRAGEYKIKYLCKLSTGE